jgi:membrane-bound lytic murein transglycosylase D
MSRIAGRYSVTVDAIRMANSLNSNFLSVGQNLLIPVSANKLAAVQPPTYVRAQTNAALRPAGAPAKIVHRVRSGENLWSIARRYRVYVHQLREWNVLDTDMLRAGQRLFVWTTRGTTTSASRGRPG